MNMAGISLRYKSVGIALFCVDNTLRCAGFYKLLNTSANPSYGISGFISLA